ncbi:PspC domain-containing protein [Calditrichota bacterium]
MKRLYRSDEDRIIAGVCGGFGEYFSIDPVIIRLIWIVLVLYGGAGLLAYFIFWIFVPRKPWKAE